MTKVTTKTEEKTLSELPTSKATSVALVVDEKGNIIPDTPASGADLMGFLSDMGFPVPIASPEQLRAAFEYQQRMYAAVLSESDYLYTVSYTSDNRLQNKVLTTLAEAQALADKFKNLGSNLNAKPKKSGIVKLARALGITATINRQQGLPGDPTATYSYVEYKAEHAGTGKSELGVGWCDLGERGGKISKHDVIATADTRAYNRAVLRLAGFGDVSAEEIIAPISGEEAPVTVPDKPTYKKGAPVPGVETDVIQTAVRAWAEAMAKRDPAPEAQQETRDARELRAKARRGDSKAASKLGALGIRWQGIALDSSGHEPWAVEEPLITPDQIKAMQAVVEANEAPAPTPEQKAGWDLSGEGKDDESNTPPPDSSLGIPQPSPSAETITTSQAKKVSGLLKSLFTDTADMKAWLKQHCHVDRTIHLRSNQYEKAMVVLSDMEKEKKANA